jgi:UDP:flavonoid glycosyltransferase YjiC (YdhE family)
MKTGAEMYDLNGVGRDSVQVPDNVEVVAFADHDRLMPGSAAVIGHRGFGTVLRALAHGVPQLLLALGRDQAFNADRVEQVGAGIRLPTDAPPRRMRTALHGLLADRRFAAQASLAARRIAADEPDRTAAEALEHTAHRTLRQAHDRCWHTDRSRGARRRPCQGCEARLTHAERQP